MKNLSILSAVMALISNQTWAQILTEDEEAEWAVYWNDRKDDYDFGDEEGQYSWVCTRRTEKIYWYAVNVSCLTLPESRHEKCKNNQLIKFNEDIQDCVNVDLPTSCDGFTELEIENLKHYNEKRLLQHNNRRALHYDTPDLEFSLDLACQALTHA